MKISEMIETRATVLIWLNGDEMPFMAKVIDYDKDAARISCYVLQNDYPVLKLEDYHHRSFFLREIETINILNTGHRGNGEYFTVDQIYSMPPNKLPFHIKIKKD